MNITGAAAHPAGQPCTSRRPLDFSVFPSLLLIATLFRLALNVSATRLVLLRRLRRQGDRGVRPLRRRRLAGRRPGDLPDPHRHPVHRHHQRRRPRRRGRARFTLDAMPGKQMAIDADLNAGLIDEDEARRRRARSPQEADFYGAMDGASKFVKGDAIAAHHHHAHQPDRRLRRSAWCRRASVARRRGLDLQPADHRRRPGHPDPGAAASRSATGLIVTRADHRGRHGHATCSRQFGQQQRAMQIAGGAVIALGVIPGLPEAAVPARRRRGAGHRPRLPKQAGHGRRRRRGGDRRPRRGGARAGHARGHRPRHAGRAAGAGARPTTWSTWSTQQRRRPARPGARPAAQARPGARHRDPAGAHPRQPRPAAAHLRHPAARRRSRAAARRRPGTCSRIGDDLGDAARHADPRAGVRAGRQVGAGRAAPAGRAHRRHGGGPRPR